MMVFLFVFAALVAAITNDLLLYASLRGECQNESEIIVCIHEGRRYRWKYFSNLIRVHTS